MRNILSTSLNPFDDGRRIYTSDFEPTRNEVIDTSYGTVVTSTRNTLSRQHRLLSREEGFGTSL
jgi:hypothetical protein